MSQELLHAPQKVDLNHSQFSWACEQGVQINNRGGPFTSPETIKLEVAQSMHLLLLSLPQRIMGRSPVPVKEDAVT